MTQNELYLSRILPLEQKRRHLAHWHQEGKLQFVTFHLADSLPQSVLRNMRDEKELWLRKHPEPRSEAENKEYKTLFEDDMQVWLDRGAGSCLLRNRENAEIVKNALEFYEEVRYLLHHFVVMPNHVHVLVEVFPEENLSKILHNWKGYTAHAINQRMGRQGTLWMNESYDRMIRNEYHYENVKDYINQNIEHGGVLWSGRTGL